MLLLKEVVDWLEGLGLTDKIVLLKEDFGDFINGTKVKQTVMVKDIDYASFTDFWPNGRSSLRTLNGKQIPFRADRFLSISLPRGYIFKIEDKYPRYFIDPPKKVGGRQENSDTINRKNSIHLIGHIEKDPDREGGLYLEVEQVVMEPRKRKRYGLPMSR